ncbi:MAG: hypothetical protein ABL949_17220, partial [Fimbriimonadaceae bacterium]
MTKIILVALSLSVVSLGASQGLVSLYTFNDTLAKSYDRDGFAQSLDFRAGRASSSSVAASYSTATVGSVTKQVA